MAALKVLLVGGTAAERAVVARACAARGHVVAGHERPPAASAGASVDDAGRADVVVALDRLDEAVRLGRAHGAPVLALAPPERLDAAVEAGVDDVESLPLDERAFAARLSLLARHPRRGGDGAQRLDDDLVAALVGLPDLVYRVDVDGRILDVRSGAHYQPEAAPADRIGKNIADVLGPAEASPLLEAVRRCHQGGAPQIAEFPFEGAQGRRWYEARMFPARDGTIVALIRELTDRKRTEHRLAASERRLHKLFHSKMLGMVEWRLDGRITDANERFLDMVGYSEEDLAKGRLDWRALTPDEHHAADARAVEEIRATGACGPYEKEYLRKDGQRVPVVMAGALLEEEAGGGISFVFDLTDRKRLEHDLRESSARFEMVALATTDAVWDLDIATGAITWNQTFHTLFGYTREEVARGLEWWSEKLHPDDHPRVVASLASAIEGDAVSWSDEYRFLTASGQYAEVFDRGYILRDATGKATRAIGAMVDLTERKQMEARLQLADRLASIGTLAAGVAHEVNNPLTHVIGSLDLAARELAADGAPRSALDAVADARRGAERVRSIVRDLRTFARVDVERRAPVDVAEALAWSARIAEPAIRPRARLIVEADPVPPVLGDESRLAQVFVNLLVNAAQAIAEGAPSRNEVRVVVSRCGEDRVQVEVKDTGAGIPPDARARIFDPFFTTKDVGEGTGLGLSICHGILTSMGGSIEVESEVGVGSTFRVRLPVARDHASGPRRPSPPPVEKRRGRVMVVEDDDLTRMLIERTLRIEHEVVGVSSAEEALRILQRGAPFDVVFSDLMMPEMTGMDLHEALARSAPEQARRVVFLTAGAFTPRAERYLQQVDNARLEKPFDPEELLAFTRERVRAAQDADRGDRLRTSEVENLPPPEGAL